MSVPAETWHRIIWGAAYGRIGGPWAGEDQRGEDQRVIMSDMRDMNADQFGELATGDPAPDFRLPASDGHEIALSAYRGTAHVVLFFVRAYG